MRGVIFNLEGPLTKNFTWGIGFKKTTQVEALALIQGFKLSHKVGIYSTIILGYFSLIIIYIIKNSSLQDLHLQILMDRIKHELGTTSKVQFIHIL